MHVDQTFLFQILQIVWINLLLSGDNAVVIALACRSLPAAQRTWGIALGAGAAVGLRVIFTIMVTGLLSIPFLKIVGGLLLLWISIKLLIDDDDIDDIHAAPSLWRAVWTIVVADLVMSLDNVIAIAAAANGSISLIVFGLALSVPLIAFGANLLVGLIERFPILVWGGAALLGWVAGQVIIEDPSWPANIARLLARGAFILPSVGTAFVLAVGSLIRWRRHAAKKSRP
jgi:YjbE family integral membrane protein